MTSDDAKISNFSKLAKSFFFFKRELTSFVCSSWLVSLSPDFSKNFFKKMRVAGDFIGVTLA